MKRHSWRLPQVQSLDLTVPLAICSSMAIVLISAALPGQATTMTQWGGPSCLGGYHFRVRRLLKMMPEDLFLKWIPVALALRRFVRFRLIALVQLWLRVEHGYFGLQIAFLRSRPW